MRADRWRTRWIDRLVVLTNEEHHDAVPVGHHSRDRRLYLYGGRLYIIRQCWGGIEVEVVPVEGVAGRKSAL